MFLSDPRHAVYSNLIEQKQDGRNICNHEKQCALPVITTMVMYGSCAQVYELPQSHCGDTGRAHCFHDCLYIYIYIYIILYIYIFIKA